MITHPCPNIHGRFSLTAVKVREGTSNSIPHKTVEVLLNHVQYLLVEGVPRNPNNAFKIE